MSAVSAVGLLLGPELKAVATGAERILRSP